MWGEAGKRRATGPARTRAVELVARAAARGGQRVDWKRRRYFAIHVWKMSMGVDKVRLMTKT